MNHHGDGSVFEQKSMRCQSCRPPSLQTDLLCTRVHAARQRPSYDLLARFWNVLNIHLSNSHRVSRDALRALLFAVCSSVGPLPRLDRLLFCPHQLPNTDLIHYANEFTSGFRPRFCSGVVVGRAIGSGGSSVVCAGLLCGALVALKFPSRCFPQEILLEYCAGAASSHPHVIAPIGLCTTAHGCALVMPLVYPCQTLRDWLADAPDVNARARRTFYRTSINLHGRCDKSKHSELLCRDWKSIILLQVTMSIMLVPGHCFR